MPNECVALEYTINYESAVKNKKNNIINYLDLLFENIEIHTLE